jgi:hypothetical protein
MGGIFMGMSLELNTIIVTKEREKRIKDNLFSLEKEGYRLFPLDFPIFIHKTKKSEPFGQAIISKVIWENNQTIVYYELISLQGVN